MLVLAAAVAVRYEREMREKIGQPFLVAAVAVAPACFVHVFVVQHYVLLVAMAWGDGSLTLVLHDCY